jgi:protein O-GlcNAc transferase
MNKQNILNTTFHLNNKEVIIYGLSNEYIFKEIDSKKEFYELPLLNYLSKVYKHKLRTVIDVGANIGNHSVFFGLFLADMVVSVEPNEDITAILEKNLTSNKIKSKIIKKGIASKKSVEELDTEYGGDNIGMAKVLKKGKAQTKDKKTKTIQLDTLDNLRVDNSFKHIDLVKVDVEGYEMEVLKGSKKVLLEESPDLLIEIADFESKKDFDSFLSQFGYLPVTVWGKTPMWHYTKKNWIFRTRCKLAWLSFKIKRRLQNS